MEELSKNPTYWISLGDFIAQVNLKMEDVNGFTIKMPWSEEIGVQRSLFKPCHYLHRVSILIFLYLGTKFSNKELKEGPNMS